MNKIDKNEKNQIILPELHNFSRDVGISIPSLNKPDLKITYFYKLFCKKHKDTVWFHDGKIYGIKYNELSERNIEVFERNNSDQHIYKALEVSKGPINTKLLLPIVIIIVYFTNNTHYFFSIMSIVLILFLTQDKISNLIYRIRINFLHK